MKCTRFEDWLEHRGEDPLSPEWADLLVHARRCPDCALSRKSRAEMFEALRQLPSPPIPSDLVAAIQATVDGSPAGSAEDSPPDRWEIWLDRLLRPVQVGLCSVCLLLALAVSLPRPPAPSTVARAVQPTEARARSQRTPAPPPPGGDERLVRVSPQEVGEFLKKLQEYRRLHPEMDPSGFRAPSMAPDEGSRGVPTPPRGDPSAIPALPPAALVGYPQGGGR